MTTLAIFASTFVLVFALGFQSLNVNNGHYKAAFFTSFAIGLANLVLFKTVPDADTLQIAAFLLGGPFGIITSMWAHHRWMPNKTKHAVAAGVTMMAPYKEPLCSVASPIPQPDGRRLCHADCPKPLFIDDPYCDGSWKK